MGSGAATRSACWLRHRRHPVVMQVLTNHSARLFEEYADVPLLLAPTLFPGASLIQLLPQAR